MTDDRDKARSEEERIEDVREEAAPPNPEPAQQEARPDSEPPPAHPGLAAGNRIGEGADEPDPAQQHGAGGALPGTTTDTSPETADAREQLTQDEEKRTEG